MAVPLLVALYKKPWQAVDKALGRPRAFGASHSFHEYARPEGGYFVLFEKGLSTQVVVTLRRPAASPEAALAALGLNAAGRRPISRDAFEAIWTNLYGLGEIRVRSSNGKTWEAVEVRVKPMATRR